MNRSIIVSILVLITVIASAIQAHPTDGQANYLLYTTDAVWSHSGTMIAAVGFVPVGNTGSIGVITLYNADTSEVIFRNIAEYGGFASVAWSLDDQFIAVGSYDQTIKVISVRQQAEVASLTGHHAGVVSVDWSPEGQTLVSSGVTDQQVILWDMSTYRQISAMMMGDPWEVDFHPDGTRVAVGGISGVYVFPLNILMNQAAATTLNQLEYRWAEAYTGSLDWSDDGSQLAFGTQSLPGVVRRQADNHAQIGIVRLSDQNRIVTLNTQLESIFGLSLFAQDGLIAAHGSNGFVQVVDIDTNAVVETFTGIERFPANVAFSLYGGRLVYGNVTTLSGLQGGKADWISGSDLKIVVPVFSLNRLNAIAKRCVANRVAPGEETSSLMKLPTAIELPDFITQVKALPSDTIPPACAADLIAVAEAIIVQGE